MESKRFGGPPSVDGPELSALSQPRVPSVTLLAFRRPTTAHEELASYIQASSVTRPVDGALPGLGGNTRRGQNGGFEGAPLGEYGGRPHDGAVGLKTFLTGRSEGPTALARAREAY